VNLSKGTNHFALDVRITEAAFGDVPFCRQKVLAKRLFVSAKLIRKGLASALFVRLGGSALRALTSDSFSINECLPCQQLG
jgi:hypothetical protein